MSKPNDCIGCHERYAQSARRLCRRCERSVYVPASQCVEREREHVVMMEAREVRKLAAAGRARYTVPETYTVIAEGYEFEVINETLGFGRAYVLPPASD